MTEISSGKIEGGCRCGAVRYSLVAAASPPVYCCHCRDCQTWSASAFSEQAIVGADTFSATGPIVEYSFRNPSGSTSDQRMCGICHTRIWNTNSTRPGVVLVRAGTLDVSDTIEPRAHIWVKRKQPWIRLPAGIPAFEESAPLAELAQILAR